MINFVGENAYYHCRKCGIELIGKEVGVVDAGVNYANGEFAPCPNCTDENLIDRDDHWKDNNLEKPTEIIVCAANKYGDLILCGARHWDKLMHSQVDNIGMVKFHKIREANKEVQGFINQFGEFRTREEAMEVVLANCQPIDLIRNGGNGKKLFSEGLY